MHFFISTVRRAALLLVLWLPICHPPSFPLPGGRLNRGTILLIRSKWSSFSKSSLGPYKTPVFHLGLARSKRALTNKSTDRRTVLNLARVITRRALPPSASASSPQPRAVGLVQIYPSSKLELGRRSLKIEEETIAIRYMRYIFIRLFRFLSVS